MKLTVYDKQGQEVDSIEADDLVFGLAPHRAVLRQALLAQLANRRAGSANTKTRGQVRGSTIKGQLVRRTVHELRRQKGLGRARQGTLRAPHHRHGGVAFGPKPRSFAQALPKMVRRLAIRSALSGKGADGELKVVRGLDLDTPKTKAVLEIVVRFDMARSALLVTGAPARNLLLSARNLPGTKTLPADYLNVADLLSYRAVLMTVEAVRRAAALWGGARAKKRLAPIPEVVVETVAAAPARRTRRG